MCTSEVITCVMYLYLCLCVIDLNGVPLPLLSTLMLDTLTQDVHRPAAVCHTATQHIHIMEHKVSKSVLRHREAAALLYFRFSLPFTLVNLLSRKSERARICQAVEIISFLLIVRQFVWGIFLTSA